MTPCIRYYTIPEYGLITSSLTWNDGRDGECDFIIFNEKKGFLALEVKGGNIDFDGDLPGI